MPLEPNKKSYSAPKPSRIRQLFNSSAMSEADTDRYPELASAWAGREIEMPAEAAATGKVRPMNWYERKFAAPDADAITWPWGTIAVNQDLIKQNKGDLGTVLAHELTHIGQNSKGPLDYLKGLYRSAKGGYSSDPREIEAFEYESKRPVRTKDIDLDPPLRKKYNAR